MHSSFSTTTTDERREREKAPFRRRNCVYGIPLRAPFSSSSSLSWTFFASPRGGRCVVGGVDDGSPVEAETLPFCNAANSLVVQAAEVGPPPVVFFHNNAAVVVGKRSDTIIMWCRTAPAAQKRGLLLHVDKCPYTTHTHLCGGGSRETFNLARKPTHFVCCERAHLRGPGTMMMIMLLRKAQLASFGRILDVSPLLMSPLLQCVRC